MIEKDYRKATVKHDLLFLLLLIPAIGIFLPFPFMKNFHSSFLYNLDYWYFTYFLKFAILATLGECLGLRISKKTYYYKGFGLLPRAIVWGFLGIAIGIAFVIFANGTPALLSKFFGLSQASYAMEFPSIFQATEAGMMWTRIITAICISVFLNLFFAPIFMTAHKISDTHILKNQGTVKAFVSPIDIAKILTNLNWNMQWGFIFKKTIPLFWIPVQSVTFLMASQYRIAFAAFLSVVLGVILAFANTKSHSSNKKS